MNSHSISNRFFTVSRLLIVLIFCTAWMCFADDSSDLFNQGKVESKKTYYATVIDRAEVSFREGKYKEAIADCNEVIRQTDYLRAYVLRGCIYFKMRDYDKVIADFNRVIRLSPEPNKNAYSLRGEAYMAKKDYTNALADYTEVIHLDPADFSSYYERGNVFKAMGNYEKAVDDYSETLRIKPDSYVYLVRGNAYNSIGQFDKAMADYDQVIRLDPQSATAYSNRGLLYSQQGDYTKGIADCSRAVQIDTNYDNAYNNLAWLLAIAPDPKLRDGQKAVEYAKKACELSGWKEAHALGTLAAAYAEAGNFEEAVKWEKKCIESGLPEKGLKQARKELDLFQHDKPYHAEK